MTRSGHVPVDDSGAQKVGGLPGSLPEGAAEEPGVEASPATSLSAGVLRLLVGRGIALGLNFVAWALVARALQPDAFGLLQFSISVIFYLSFITDFGLTTLGTRDLATQRQGSPLIRQILGLRLALAAAAAVAGAVGIYLFADAAETWTWTILLSTVPASALNTIWVLRAIGSSRRLALIDVASAIVLVCGAVTVWLVHPEPILAATVYALSQWVGALISLASIRHIGWLRPTVQGGIRHLRSALPLGVAVLAVNVYYSADTVLLGVLRTTDEVGYYAAAYKLVLPWLLVASIVGHLAMPALAKLVLDRPTHLARSLGRLSTTLTVFGTSAAVGVTIMAPVLTVTIFGTTYAPAAIPLAILIWSCVTVFANAPFGFLMLARRQDRAYMWTAVAGASVNLILNAILIPIHGMIGAAIATIAAEVIVLSLMLVLTRDVSVPIVIRSAGLAIPIASVVGLGMWPFASSLMALPIGVTMFFASLFVARVVTPQQLREGLQVAASRRH